MKKISCFFPYFFNQPVPLLRDLRDPSQLLPVPHPMEAEDPSAPAKKEPLGGGERRST